MRFSEAGRGEGGKQAAANKRAMQEHCRHPIEIPSAIQSLRKPVPMYIGQIFADIEEVDKSKSRALEREAMNMFVGCCQ
jgi:hypothetical protein